MSKSVFSPVVELPKESVTEAAYQMLLLFNRRAFLEGNTVSELLDSLSQVSGAPITPPLKEGIEKSISNIESKEGQSLRNVDSKHLSRYAKELTGLVFDLASEFAEGGSGNSDRDTADAKKHQAVGHSRSPSKKAATASVALAR